MLLGADEASVFIRSRGGKVDMRFLAIIGVLLTIGCADPIAQRRVETGFVDRSIELNGQTYRYQVYVPAEYTPDRAWPVIMDLHGNTMQGTDARRHTAVALGHQIRLDRTRFSVIVVFPQAQPNTRWADPRMQDMAMAQLEATTGEFKTDANRIYLTGFSMGAGGAYRFAYRWPNKFAALVIIAGAARTNPALPTEAQEVDRKANPFVTSSDPAQALAERIKHIPISISHSVADQTTPIEDGRRVLPSLRALGAPLKYTEYPAASHVDTVNRAFADPELIQWILAQRRR